YQSTRRAVVQIVFALVVGALLGFLLGLLTSRRSEEERSGKTTLGTPHLRRLSAGDLFDTYAESSETVWGMSKPATFQGAM
ncbi:MAG TPA: hypothetical protein VJX10_18505, partial [Pseudonocardiaceae bacterium]|nr:hypothetical protein [Pseudonocardiaceae bacterium]